MRALVTGGAGFIGSNLAKRLFDSGWNVDICDDLSNGHGEFLKDIGGIKFFYDFASDIILDKIRSGVYDIIFHQAAIPRVSYSVENPFETNNINVNKTVKLMEACVGNIKRFVFASSSSVYGGAENLPTSEFEPKDPISPYALQKSIIEEYCKLFSKLYGLDSVCLRYFNCFDEKTEVLTKKGFKFFKEVEETDEIATLNQETGILEYYKPIAKQVHAFDGKMIHFKSKFIDLMVTPEHMLYGGIDGFYKRISAQEVVDRKIYNFESPQFCLNKHRRDYGYDETFVIPAVKNDDGRLRESNDVKIISSSLWCKFLGWFLSEGSVFSRKNSIKSDNFYYRVSISQKDKAHLEEIKSIIKEMGFTYYESNKKNRATDIIVSSKQLFNVLKHFIDDKYIPRYILERYSPKDLELLFNNLIKGDGHKNNRRYTTKYKRFADSFQELMFLTGRVGKIRKEYNKKFKKEIYRIDFKNSKIVKYGTKYGRKLHCKYVPYKGKVYDLTVPNHTLFVRRNGFVTWSGNCFGPNQYGDSPYSTAVSAWCHAVKNGMPLRSDGDGEQSRDLCYVDNVVDANMIVATSNLEFSGDCFNVACGDRTTNNEILEVFKKKFPGIKIVQAPERAGDVKHTQADISALMELGYKGNVKFLDGLERTIKWWKI